MSRHIQRMGILAGAILALALIATRAEARPGAAQSRPQLSGETLSHGTARFVIHYTLHGIDAVRLGFAPYYHEVPGLSVSYLYLCALSLLLLGLSLQIAFAKRMVTQ